MDKDEFRKLQKIWYEKLAEAGFKDVEEMRGNTFFLKQSTKHPFRHVNMKRTVTANQVQFKNGDRSKYDEQDLSLFVTDRIQLEAKEEYYRVMSHLAYDIDTPYDNKAHEYILKKWSDGETIAKISEGLTTLGEDRERKAIRFTIRRYEMRWGLKSYRRKEIGRWTEKDGSLIYDKVILRR